jgi:hypothetical protein
VKQWLSYSATYSLAMWSLLGQSLVPATQPLRAQGQKDTDGSTWCRTPENDAINCLYLQLLLLGYTESYETFRQKVRGEPRSFNLKSLAELGRELGFRLTPVTTSVSELAQAGMPAIVHLEEHGSGTGRFLLFLWADKDETTIAVIDGSDVKFAQMPRDRFRRNWTGYALTAQPPISWELWLRRLAALGVICAAGLWSLGRVGNLGRSLAFFSRGTRWGVRTSDAGEVNGSASMTSP